MGTWEPPDRATWGQICGGVKVVSVLMVALVYSLSEIYKHNRAHVCMCVNKLFASEDDGSSILWRSLRKAEGLAAAGGPWCLL